VDDAAKAIAMQVVGVSAAIVPILALFVGLGIASRRRRAAEQAELAEPPSEA
jgi:hypothetical protein